MLRLNRLRDRERGAVAVIVVAGLGVLTGVAALTIDAGSLYAERRVVQNGADAASLALAQACARGDVAKCSPSSGDLTNLANLNSRDGFTDIASVCGTTAPFAGCGAIPGPALVQCVKLTPLLPDTAKWVEVRTKTHSTTGNPSVVPKAFANLFDPSYTGKAVQACARAAWGPPATGTATLPFTISSCEWDHATGATPGPPRFPTAETALGFNYEKKKAGCASFNGHDFPGGFGWTDRTSPTAAEPCTAQILVGGWLGSQTAESNGIGGGNSCAAIITGYVGKDVLIPVYDCVNDDRNLACPAGLPGVKTWYHVAGLAKFHLTALDVTGQISGGTPSASAKTYCSKVTSDKKCIYGYFIEGLVPVGTIGGPGTPNLGATVVQAAG
jgi:hypothetical protein